MWEGGKSFVTGIAGLAGHTVQYLGDSTVLGRGGDALRGVTGKMPDWLEAAVPSSQRGQLSDAAIGKAASNAFHYLNTHTPQQAGADIGAAIGKAWDGLKADHAKAAAGGPAAEARWWGKTAGRISFEVAATFVPVAGVAGKLSKGAKAAELGVDAVRGAEVLTDAGRVAGKAGTELADAGKVAGKAITEVAETLLSRAKRILGNIPLNSKSLDDLYQAGKLTMDEARSLAKNVGWKSADGRWIYPPNEGVDGLTRSVKLTKGDQIIVDRYGKSTGSYASQLGESYSSRALPPGSEKLEFHVYKIVDDVNTKAGKATAWFGEIGGAIQCKFEKSIDELLFQQKLVELRR